MRQGIHGNRRAPRLGAAAALTVAMLTVVATRAGAAPVGPDVAAAVTYLTTTTGANGLTGGTSLAADGYYESFTDFADFGLTMDGALALAATASDDTVLAKVVAFLQRGKDASGRAVDAYTGIGLGYATGGAIAKEALVAEVTGYDPRTFGGTDLITALDGTVCTAAASADGCAGVGAFVGSPSTFAQALGVIALLRAGDHGQATTPVAYLESLANGAGGFPSTLPGTATDVDSTAVAAMALALAAGDDALATGVRQTAATEEAKALALLVSSQLPGGGWEGTAGDSTNSAALAIQALDLAPGTYATTMAAGRAFLAAAQDPDGGFPDATGPGAQAGSDVRASTQTVGGIVGTSFGVLTDDIATAVPPSSTPATSASSPAATSTTPPSATAASVLPTTTAISPASPAAAAATLPYSGAETGPLTALGIGLIAAGAGALVGGSRLRRRTRAAGRRRASSR